MAERSTARSDVVDNGWSFLAPHQAIRAAAAECTAASKWKINERTEVVDDFQPFLNEPVPVERRRAHRSQLGKLDGGPWDLRLAAVWGRRTRSSDPFQHGGGISA